MDMRKFFRFLLPVVVLAVCVAVGIALIRTAPKAERRPSQRAVPSVEVVQANPSNYAVVVGSQGTVAPRTESTLIPEVSGQVIAASANFQTGGFFEAGEILLEIDPRDYQNAVVVAEADLAQANANLDEEKARVAQALRDWEVLKLAEEPNDLALRKPQLNSAQAAVAAAEARLAQANINLERTRIRAPYAGLVLEKQVDVGQYVSPGNVLAKVYAIDLVEIRLPLSDNHLVFLDLPESYRDDSAPIDDETLPNVTLFAVVGRKTHEWQGRIVRTEGSIDTQSRQIFVVAQVDDPYARRHGTPLKVGQFVEAHIQGRVLEDVFVLPRGVLRSNGEVLVVGNDNLIERRQVDVMWSDNDEIVIGDGLAEGERVSLTALPYAISGTEVQIRGDEPTSE